MHFSTPTHLLAVLATLSLTTTATLDPATSNTKGKFPSSPGCAVADSSTSIQAAECSHNTRLSGTQTFAVFTTDHQYDDVNGAPYGTCEAYACAPGAEMASDADKWTFFWGQEGEEAGEGAGCIKSPDTGVCGCENSSDGQFIEGSDDCV